MAPSSPLRGMLSRVTAAVLWDFDGTLATRTGRWSGCLVEALSVVAPDHGLDAEMLRPGLRAGFPWHTPAVGHAHSADSWWAALSPTLLRAYVLAGVPEALAVRAAAGVRERYTDPSCWVVYDDVGPAFAALAAYRHVVVSNHVPELRALVAALGLPVDAVVCSAEVGWEKPHPALYAAALHVAGSPESVWMVGDNVEADVRGAEACGIPAILVRTEGEAPRRAATLAEVVTYVLA